MHRRGQLRRRLSAAHHAVPLSLLSLVTDDRIPDLLLGFRADRKILEIMPC